MAPDDGDGGGDVGGPRCVAELRLVAVDVVLYQLGIHCCHSTLNVELANEPEYQIFLCVFNYVSSSTLHPRQSVSQSLGHSFGQA